MGCKRFYYNTNYFCYVLNMKIETKKEYLEIIRRIFDDIKTTDILQRLENIGAILTFEFYAESDGEVEDIPIEVSTPLAYIYNSELLTNETKLFQIQSLSKNIYINEVYTNVFKGIAESLNQYRLSGIFDEIQKFMAWDIITYDLPYNEQYILFLKELNIYINRVKILTFKESDNPRNYYEDDIIFNQNRVFADIDMLLNKPILPFNKNLTNKVWFMSLCDESKQLIIAGENLISQFEKDLKDNNNINYDLSCFLLPFVKAIESEIPHFMEKHCEKIIDLASRVFQLSKKISFTGKYKSLPSFAESILKNRDNIKNINSITSLYKIIHYFGFTENMGILENAKSIFNENIVTYLRNDDRIVKELENLGKDRNNFIHANLISQFNVFEFHYLRLNLTLEFLAKLNEAEKQNN